MARLLPFKAGAKAAAPTFWRFEEVVPMLLLSLEMTECE